MIKDAHLVYTDPCEETHDIENFVAHVKRARVFGCIEYIISAQSTISEVTGATASVSDFYTAHVDHVVEFIGDANVDQGSVIVTVQNLAFDNPAEYVYGGNHALRIKGEFVLNLGYVENGSFENGFSGWTRTVPPEATAEIVKKFEDYRPIDACWFALLKTDGPGTYTSVQQDFYANAGDKISGWAFFRSNDYMPFNDSCDISIMSGDIVLSTPFSASVSTVGDYGKTPWTQWEYTLTESGLYTVKAEIRNSGDSILDSFMGVDDIRLTIG